MVELKRTNLAQDRVHISLDLHYLPGENVFNIGGISVSYDERTMLYDTELVMDGFVKKIKSDDFMEKVGALFSELL